MQLSFAILVDINCLVRIVQFVHIVFCVWVSEAVLCYYYFFYGDNYILSAVYLLVLMDLNLAKLVRVYQVLPFLN